jgi:hypothetical protein
MLALELLGLESLRGFLAFHREGGPTASGKTGLGLRAADGDQRLRRRFAR